MSMSADIENKTNNNNRVVVILGMHRAGTSALTRSLQVLGIGLGDNLYEATPENPTGYWEDRDCIAINEELIGHFGAEYDRLGLDWDIISTDPSIDHLYTKAIQLVSESVAKNRGMWGVKDPRMCRLLGFWKKVFDICGCSVNYIISLRNPISVAKSLEKRNHLPPEKSYLLWLQYMVSALLGSSKEARIVVDYDLFVDAPEEQIARIADHLKIPLDMENNPLLMDFSRNFLDNNLRHSTYSLSQIHSDGRLPYDALKAYELLLRIAKDEISIESDEVQSGFEQIQSNLQVYASVFTYATLFEERELNNLLSFARAYAPEIYPDLRKRWVSYLITVPESEVDRLGFYHTANGREEQITDLPQSITAGKVQLMTTLVDRNGEIANLKQAVTELKQDVTELKQALTERDGQIASLNGQIANLNGNIASHYGQTANLNDQIARHIGQIATLNQIINELNQEITAHTRQNLNLNLAIVERDKLISSQQADLDSITRGNAWKLLQKYWEIRNRIFGLAKGKK
jgi:O-antigen biosynthesis protein